MWYAQRFRVWITGLGAFLALLGLANALHAQTVSEDQVKAAYLYKFAKFVEWPAGKFASPAAPLRFCILDDGTLASELALIIQGKAIAGRPVIVAPVQNGDESRACHILFIGSSHAGQTRHLFEALRQANVLTVSEVPGFVHEGGMINFVLQGNRVQFQVNHKAATAAGLHISSRLLTVARLVLE